MITRSYVRLFKRRGKTFDVNISGRDDQGQDVHAKIISVDISDIGASIQEVLDVMDEGPDKVVRRNKVNPGLDLPF
jgi:hypothetical protein